jgi:hypothetical protein
MGLPATNPNYDCVPECSRYENIGRARRTGWCFYFLVIQLPFAHSFSFGRSALIQSVDRTRCRHIYGSVDG